MIYTSMHVATLAKIDVPIPRYNAISWGLQGMSVSTKSIHQELVYASMHLATLAKIYVRIPRYNAKTKVMAITNPHHLG